MAEAKIETKEKFVKKAKAQKPEPKKEKNRPEKKVMKEMKEVAYEGQPYETIKFVLMTEKAVRFIETQNRLMFVVDRKADKKQVKAAVEAAFKTKISDVNVLIDQKGRKRAFVKFTKPGEAGEIAIRLGII